MTKVVCIDNDYNKIREPWSSGFKNNFWQSKLPCGAKCSLIIGNITYLPIQLGQILDAGNYIITAVLTITNPNYVARTYSITNTLKVMPIKPTITYYTPRPIVAGGHLSSLELDAQTNLPAANILYSVPLGTIINSRTAINAYLTPPYYNSNFLDEPVYTNVVLNII